MERVAHYTQNKREKRSYDVFARDVGAPNSLSRNEERDLFRRFREGDKSLINQIVATYLPFVIWLVTEEYWDSGGDLRDLVQEGSIGLMKAAETFDERLGFQFTTWVSTVVESKIATFLRTHPPFFSNRYVSFNGDDPMDHDEERDAPAALRDEILKHLTTPETDTWERLGTLIRRLEKKDPQAAFVAKLYFGIGMDEPLPVEEIGTLLHVGRTRIYQIKDRAIRKMRKWERHGINLSSR